MRRRVLLAVPKPRSEKAGKWPSYQTIALLGCRPKATSKLLPSASDVWSRLCCGKRKEHRERERKIYRQGLLLSKKQKAAAGRTKAQEAREAADAQKAQEEPAAAGESS